jgi:hypothetical protein
MIHDSRKKTTLKIITPSLGPSHQGREEEKKIPDKPE